MDDLEVAEAAWETAKGYRDPAMLRFLSETVTTSGRAKIAEELELSLQAIRDLDA